LFYLCSVSGSTEEESKHFTVVVDSFIGKLMKVKVSFSSELVSPASTAGVKMHGTPLKKQKQI